MQTFAQNDSVVFGQRAPPARTGRRPAGQRVPQSAHLDERERGRDANVNEGKINGPDGHGVFVRVIPCGQRTSRARDARATTDK